MEHSIVYYISAHGYGHGVRSTDILRALFRLQPEIRVTVVTDLPEEFLAGRLGGCRVVFRRAALDVGMVQVDSIKVDVAATRRRVEDLYRGRAGTVQTETDFLQRTGASVVVSDIPALPLEAAAAAGLPSLAVGNFGWDWIYEEFARDDAEWTPLVEQIRAGYRQAGLLLRLPFAEDMAAFPRRRDLPLVASPGQARRMDLARRTGADPAKPWVLLSFTALDWDEAALRRVSRLRDYEFLAVQPLAWPGSNIHTVHRAELPFADVLASADVVISKPGFGILSECVVNGKPLIYSERTDFREYAVLVRAIERYLRHVHLPGPALYAGDLGGALEALRAAPAPGHVLDAGGDLEAAQAILRWPDNARAAAVAGGGP